MNKRILSLILAVPAVFACDSSISYDDYILPTEDVYTAVPANEFLGSIGVNSSIDNRGETLEKTVECMKYLGARWIRSGYTPTPSRFDPLIEAGVKFSVSVNADDQYDDDEKINLPIETAKYLKERNALIAMEGANEPNNWDIYYGGEVGGGSHSWVPLAQMHTDFYEAVKATPELADVDVWTISEAGAMVDNVGLQYLTIPAGAGCLLPEGTRFADAVNIHNYFSHGNFPAPQNNQTWEASDPSSACPVDGLYGNHGLTWANNYRGYSESECMTIRKVTTETGITLSNPDDWDEGPINQEMQGLMYMSCYLAQFARGWEYTAMYILRDRSDEAGNQTFGFYSPDYKARTAALYLHNLTTILADDQSIANPGRVAFSISDKPETVHNLLLQKFDGTYCLVVWGEKYLGGTDKIEVRFRDTYSSIAVYDPTVGTEPVETLTDTNVVPLEMSNKPFILQFR